MCLFRKASQSHHIQRAENTTGPAIASAIAIRLKRSATVKVPENTPHKRQRTMGIIVIFDAAFSRGFTPSCPEVEPLIAITLPEHCTRQQSNSSPPSAI